MDERMTLTEEEASEIRALDQGLMLMLASTDFTRVCLFLELPQQRGSAELPVNNVFALK